MQPPPAHAATSSTAARNGPSTPRPPRSHIASKARRSAVTSSSSWSYADQPTTGQSISIYTYGMSTGEPVLIHQALYRPPFDPRADGTGFSGFQYVYEPSKSSELQYWCQALP
jgi:hypothetical protein